MNDLLFKNTGCAITAVFTAGQIHAEDIDLFASGYCSQGGADSLP